MKSATLRMSKLDMLAGGIRKFEMVVVIAAPCSTKREAICVKTTEAETPWAVNALLLVINIPCAYNLGRGFPLGLKCLYLVVPARNKPSAARAEPADTQNPSAHIPSSSKYPKIVLEKREPRFKAR
ncbi:hypothetical protein SCA6_004992 [Theobroma cacao]